MQYDRCYDVSAAASVVHTPITPCARRILERAKCLRPGAAAAGSVEVYHAADDNCPAGGPGKWKVVDLASAADQQRRHSLLDFTAHTALHCMTAALEDAWQAELLRLDILKLPLDDYIDQYMGPLDVAEMSEGQRDEHLHPARAIQQMLAVA
jgi:hypothetical protein